MDVMTEIALRHSSLKLVHFLFTILLLCSAILLSAVPARSQTQLVGDTAVENTIDSSPRGTAEAFQATGSASGQISYLNVYLDPTSTAAKISMGIYSDAGGHPGTLLTQGSNTQLVAGTWNGIAVTSVSITAGTHYWIAILGTQSGTLQFRDISGGTCNSVTSSQTSLTTLPSSWSTGTSFTSCPLSAYASNAAPPGPDTIIGDDSVESLLDTNPAGQAEAFQATANNSSSVGAINLYLDPTSTACDVFVGLYSDSSGSPGSLLGQGSTSQPVAGSWNQISISSATITAGQHYWIAVLGTGGNVEFRDRNAGACQSKTTSQKSLTSLPSSWTTDKVFSTCPLSAYGLLGTSSTLPVANAGPAQTVPLNALAQLDGTGSTDPSANSLTYQWSFVSVPTGSVASLSSGTAVRPTFVADNLGNYTLQLIVSDSTQTSLPSTTIISTSNSAPVANAGPAQTVHVSATVQLNGRGSTDVDGDPLTYSWIIAAKPSGSSAILANSSLVNPTFVADVAGNYTVQLIVNDGHANSAPNQVIVSTTNSAPVANPGPNQLVLTGTTVKLDGSGSTDIDGNPLTYSWAILNKPSGSSASFSSLTAFNPSFLADANGTYVLQLIVNDGTVNSAPATVVVATDNIAPIANAGPDQSHAVGAFVTFDGSGSSAVNGRTLGYHWALASRPASSNAVLGSPLTVRPNFTVDAAGTYVVQLIVNDGYSNSAPSTVVISTINSTPVANPKPNQMVSVGATVTLSGSNSSDADGDTLTYAWAILSQPAGGTATLTNGATVHPTFVPNVTGVYIAQLIVNDGKVNSNPATVTITANSANQPPVVSAGPNQTISLPTTTVNLNGTATDDGLPNGTLTVQWTQVSATVAGTVTFSNPNSAATQATLPAVGSYLLKLTANDSQLSSSATVTVTLTQANQPPIVTVGLDQTITYPVTTASLTGTIRDDGLPFGNSLTIGWTKVAGPGSVTFTNPAQANAQAMFAVPGIYVLRLSASDGQYTGSGTTRVTFVAPSYGSITANAGPDQVLVFPAAVTLAGSALDSNPPAGSTLSVSWSTVSGPGAATFASPTSLSTQVIFSKPGVYDLRLTATDGIYTATSDLKVYEGNLQCTSSNKGTDFWLMFTGADYLEPQSTFTSPPFRQLSFFISSDVATSGTVSVPGQGLNLPFSVTPGQITTINLPQSVQVITSDTIETNGVHITSQNPVAVYGFNFVPFATDGYLGLPTITLGTSYVIASYQNTVGAQGFVSVGTEFGVTATQDNTTVTIIPTSSSGTRQAHVPYTIQLNQGQTYQLRNETDLTELGVPNGPSVDFTGSVVTSDKPIAVFGAHDCVNIPAGFRFCNSLVEELPPTNLWGQNFVTMPLAEEQNGDVFRFLAQIDNTQVQVNHRQVAVLQKGQFYEQNISGPAEISANNPILTIQYAKSQTASGTLNDDPTMIVVPPFEQFGGTYTFNTPTSNFPINFVNVIAPAAAAQGGTVLFDGAQVPASAFQPIGTSPFVGAQLPASVGPHTLTASLPFGIWVYGFNFTDAYGYTGGVCFSAGAVGSTVAASPKSGTNQITSQITLQATVLNSSGAPIGGSGVTFSVAGVNSQAGFSTTNASGVATFSYTSLKTGSDIITITAGAASDTASLIWVSNGPNHAPVVSAGPNQTISLPANSVTLNGSVVDDGLPTGGTLTSTWAEVSGPSTVSLRSPNQPQTTATFSQAGTYVLQLTGNDSLLSSSANVTITVLPPNQPPTVSAGSDRSFMWLASSAVPQPPLQLTGTATDDGLPVGGNLSVNWGEVSGPDVLTFQTPSSNGPTYPTTAAFNSPGTYVVRLSANDTQFTTASYATIHAYGPVTTNLGPSLQTSVNTPITLNGNVLVAGQAPTLAMPLTINWVVNAEPSGAQVTLGSPTSAVTTATFNTAGAYQLKLLTGDANLPQNPALTNCCLNVNVVSANTPLPSVAIAAPLDGAQITSPTTVTGSVSSGTGGTWTLDYALQDDFNPMAFTTLATGAGGITNATLGTFDPTILLNGTYVIRLTSVNAAAQFMTTSVTVSVARNMKVGVFSLSFNDLTVPVAGIPIQVIRSYDSRDKGQGDFGVGWRLSLANIRVQKNRNLSLNWQETQTFSGFLPQYCLFATDNKLVTVTFPDGRLFTFQTGGGQMCQQAGQIVAGTMSFVEQPGPANTAGAMLTPADGGQFIVDGNAPGAVDLVAFDGNPYNPTTFVLQTADGAKFTIDQKLGLTAVTDANGNALTITANGITSPRGKSVPFARDEQGRITRITDPDGNMLFYSYNGNGDLAGYTDRAGNTTAYAYDGSHDLTGITTPDSKQVLTNTFDGSGRLTATKDGNGFTVSFSNNVAAQTQTVTDRNGNPTTYSYDADGNVTQVTDALGNISSSTFDASDNKLSDTNALGKTSHYTYDNNGNRLTETDPLQHATSYTYNALNKPLTISDPNGHATTNTYDANGNLLTTTDANGKTTSNTYSSSGSLLTTQDPLGKTTSFAYDIFGNLSTQTDAMGTVTTYTYDANANRSSQSVTRTLAGGTHQTLLTSYVYDGDGKLLKTTYPDNSTTQTIYNGLGQLVTSIDPLGRQTSHTYDTDGHVTLTTYPDNTTESTTYDHNGNRLQFTDRTGIPTSYAYDALNRLTQSQRGSNVANPTITSSTFDAIGEVLTSTDANHNVTTYAYDAAGRRTSVINALNQTSTFVYDAAGNQTSAKDANQNVTTYTYDSDNRRTQVTYPDTKFETTTYDSLGRVTVRADANGKTTQYGYDALGRLSSVTDALGQITSYVYDEVGNRIAQTDANTHTTTYTYDQRGRRVHRTLPLGQSETYTYDPAGNLSTRTDFNSKTTVYAYDSMNRLLSKTPDPSFHAPAVTYAYYPTTGQQESMIDASGTTIYGNYDNNGHVTDISSLGGRLFYTYDPAGNMTEISTGSNVFYTYDALNRLSTVTTHDRQNNTLVTTYTYDNVGNLASVTYPNGVVHNYTYDTRNRLTNLGVNGTVSGAPGAIASYAYTLDAAGHRTGVAELSGRKVSFGYDNLYRLTSETIASDPNAVNGAVSYTYDPVGNRTQKVSTLPGYPGGLSNYNANDQLATDTYDADGNTVGSGTNTGTTGYVYDFENRLIQQGGISIVYDGNGNRRQKTVAGVTTIYWVAEQNPTGYAQVVQEEASNGAPLEQYVYGLEQIARLQVNGTPPTVYYVHDGHGSVRALTNTTGTVTDTYDYDAFGNLLHSSTTLSSPTPNNYLFAGEQFDPDLGLYYNRARYLNVSTGRFFTMDMDEGDDQDTLTLHKYIYANADPVDGADPSGFQDSLAELGAEESMSIVLDTMAVPQLGGLRTAKLGIGIEPVDPSAVHNNVLNVAIDPGHAFVYIKNLGQVTSILSFGPGAQIGPSNIVQFLRGGLAGNAHWPLGGSANTWEFPIDKEHTDAAKKAISDFKQNVPNYTITSQCTSAALTVAAKAGLSLPSGVGPVIARESRVVRGHEIGVTLWSGNVANPYHLNQQMIQSYGSPTVVNTGTFPAP